MFLEKNFHMLSVSKVLCVLDPRKNNTNQVKKAENETSSEGGNGQRSSKNSSHTLCEQRKTNGQRIESEAPDSEGL